MDEDKILLKIWELNDKGLSSRKIEKDLLKDGISKSYKTIQRILKKPRPKKPVPKIKKIVPKTDVIVPRPETKIQLPPQNKEIESLKAELKELRNLIKGPKRTIPSYEDVTFWIKQNPGYPIHQKTLRKDPGAWAGLGNTILKIAEKIMNGE